ncbi:MAG: general stress protein [Acidimicrobiia bacterium]
MRSPDTEVPSSAAPVAAQATDRRQIATYPTYTQAQAAVDALADAQFPVERLSIVADGLRFVEHVLGRRGYREATMGSLVSGALLGAALGFFFGLFDWVQPLVSGLALAFYGLTVGAVAGALVGAVTHWMSAGRRDFSSVSSLDAERYGVVCDPASAPAAEKLLAAAGSR